MKIIPTLVILSGFVGAFGSQLTAASNSVKLFDTTISLFNGDALAPADAVYDVRWGTFSGGVFTPLLGNEFKLENNGYYGDPFGDGFATLDIVLSQGDNTVVAKDIVLALSISMRDYQSTYVSSGSEIILTDTDWVTPTFGLFDDPLRVNLTADTTALKGSYNFNGGNEILNFASSAIPEPSSFAALAGLGILGAVVTRRRRSA